MAFSGDDRTVSRSVERSSSTVSVSFSFSLLLHLIAIDTWKLPDRLMVFLGRRISPIHYSSFASVILLLATSWKFVGLCYAVPAH